MLVGEAQRFPFESRRRNRSKPKSLISLPARAPLSSAGARSWALPMASAKSPGAPEGDAVDSWLGDGVGWADGFPVVVGFGVGVGVTVVLAHAATTTAVSRTAPTRAVVRLIATDPATRGPNAIRDIAAPPSPSPASPPRR